MVVLSFIWTPWSQQGFQASWSLKQTSYFRNWNPGFVWSSAIVVVTVLLLRAGEVSFLVEEEADFRKFPDSHLSFPFRRGRRNELRRRRMGWHPHQDRGHTPSLWDQCEFKGLANLSALSRGTQTIQFSIFALPLYIEFSHNLVFNTIKVLRLEKDSH